MRITSSRSRALVLAGAVALLAGSVPASVAAAATGVECGLISSYVAPHPSGSTTGSPVHSEVVVAGCSGVAPITPPATDTDTSESMAAISTISGGGLVIALLAGWYGAAVALRRRSTRPTQDR